MRDYSQYINQHGFDFSARYRLQDWANEPLSDFNRRFRVQCLAAAFGLRLDIVVRFLAEPTQCSLGGALQWEMVRWTQEYPDLSHNNPCFEKTFFASLELD